MLFEGHDRIAQPFMALSAALIGFSSLLLGAFSRFGLWRQVGVAVLLLLLVQAIATVSTSVGEDVPRGWMLAYVAPVVGIAIGVFELWLTQRPRRVPKLAVLDTVAT